MGNIYRVRTVLSGWQGAPGLQTFYFEPVTAGTIDTVEAAGCVARVRDGLEPTKGMYPTSWSAQVSGDVDIIDAVTGVLITTFSSAPLAVISGTGAAAPGYGPTPSGILLTLNTSTVSSGSRIRGRSFFVPVGNAVDANGSPNAEYLATVLAAGQRLMSTVGPGGHLTVWRRPRKASTLLPARPGTSALVTGVTVRDKYTVLRSRRD